MLGGIPWTTGRIPRSLGMGSAKKSKKIQNYIDNFKKVCNVRGGGRRKKNRSLIGLI